MTLPRRIPSGDFALLRDGVLGLLPGAPAGGEDIRDFERAFASAIGVPTCSAVSSGRLGLLLLLEALRFSPGDEVLMGAYNFHVVPEVVERAGLVPTFADLDRDTLNVSAAELERRIGPRTVAIIATHLFGQPCDIGAIREVCDRRGVVLIEDCAHALGARVAGRHVGTFGDAAFFSFETVKHVNTFGGGMVVVRDDAVRERFEQALGAVPAVGRRALARKLFFAGAEWLLSRPRVFGGLVAPLLAVQYARGTSGASLVARYKKAKRRGGDFRRGYTPLQARAGLRQLGGLERGNEVRRAHAQRLTDALGGHAALQRVLPDTLPAWYMFVVGVDEPEGFVRGLFARGVDASTKVMDHCPPRFGTDDGFPGSRWASEHLVQLPFHASLDDGAVGAVARAARGALGLEIGR